MLNNIWKKYFFSWVLNLKTSLKGSNVTNKNKNILLCSFTTWFNFIV